MPKRIQRKRTKGWKMPQGAVYVGRPSKFGNPWTHAATLASGLFKPECVSQVNVDEFRGWLVRPIAGNPLHESLKARRDELLLWLPTIRGRDLACFCRLDEPCHADVLLELANR